MSIMMTLTEFNQQPSRASRIAEDGEDVIITRRGQGVLLLSRLNAQPSTIEIAIREGWAEPPKHQQSPPRVFPTLDIDPDIAIAAIEEFEASRDPFAF